MTTLFEDEELRKKNNQKIIGIITLCVIGVVLLAMYLFPKYKIWEQEQSGKAELAKAEYSKKISVEVAKAKKDSAQYEADAEVLRATGVAEANRIIGDSLKSNEAYLRYLWITHLDQNGQVIYVPTEAGLPILEAGRLARPN